MVCHVFQEQHFYIFYISIMFYLFGAGSNTAFYRAISRQLAGLLNYLIIYKNTIFMKKRVLQIVLICYSNNNRKEENTWKT